MRNIALNNSDDEDKLPTAPELDTYSKNNTKPTIKDDAPQGVVEPDDILPSEEQDAAEEVSSDIMGDEDAQDTPEESPVMVGGKPNIFKRFFGWFRRHKWWSFLLLVLAVAGATLAVPATRYPVAALLLKRNFNVVITDSKTHLAVSGASVDLWGHTVMTDAEGKATVKVKVGKGNMQVSKQYYQAKSQEVFVGIGTKHNTASITIDATGRQVPISVTNKITGGPVAGALIKVLDTNAKTDAEGKAIIVLPTTATTQNATISSSGYNDTKVKIQVTESIVTANKFTLTPSGKVYFLSNQRGKLDVVKTNLDGTDRKIVLAGTGNEDLYNTSLLASRDWKYLALLSKRDSSKTNSKIHLINTSNDQVTTMEEGSANFTLVGWSEHTFVYQVVRSTVKDWKNGKGAVKSYNADSGKLLTLDQTIGEGTSDEDYAQQYYGDSYYGGSAGSLVDDKLVVSRFWGSSSPNTSRLNGKKSQIVTMNVDGSGKKVLKEFALSAAAGVKHSYANVHKPYDIYFRIEDDSASTYYQYRNGTVTQSKTITDDSFNKIYPTYLLSPSDKKTFWSETRDGKNTLFIGDDDGNSAKEIASLSEYKPYGWFTDTYLLVSQDSSELYIMPASGGKPYKITDYYKASSNYSGYGGGYGGL